MFTELGMKIDNLISDIKGLNRKVFWYKFYTYFYCKKHHSKELNKMAFECGYLYKWQYKKLLQKFR